jgi:ABC-type transporter Mla subunit MlaD
MYLNLIDVVGRHESVWNGIAAYAQFFTTFKANVEQINTFNQALQGSSKGFTAGKNRLKAAMAEKTMGLVSTLRAFATTTYNVQLAKEIEMHYSGIIQTKDTDADDLCQYVHSRAVIHLAALGDFGIRQADIDALKDAIDQYSAAISRTKSAITQTKSLNAQLSDLFKVTDRLLLQQADQLMYRFKTVHPIFYNEYFSARASSQSTRSPKEESPLPKKEKEEV